MYEKYDISDKNETVMPMKDINFIIVSRSK